MSAKFPRGGGGGGGGGANPFSAIRLLSVAFIFSKYFLLFYFLSHFYLTSVLISIVIERTHVPKRARCKSEMNL